MTTDALCATHGKSIYEHTAEAICRCFGLAPCPACRGDRLTDGSSRCATCGACGVVLSVRDDARVSDARLMSKSWTPELRARLIATYDMRYEDLSADAFEDSDGEMSRREKSERAMSAVLSVFRWWLVSGEVKHWREARAALESYSGISPSEGSAPDTKPDEPEHPEARCERCGRPNVVWFTRNALWNVAVPDGGILCPVCFVQSAESRGIVPTGWFLVPESVEGDERIAEIRERLGNATPGPWVAGKWNHAFHDGDNVRLAVKRPCGVENHDDCSIAQISHLDADADAQFIAHAPEDIAYLLSRVIPPQVKWDGDTGTRT